MLAGSEVQGSCLHVSRSNEHTAGLLGYLLNGHNKLLAIRDGVNERSLARGMLRILLSRETREPILFLDNIYPKNTSPELKQALLNYAVHYAQELRLPLTSLVFISDQRFSQELYSLRGLAPFDYIDAIVGAQKDGVFEIAPPFLHYQP